MPQFNREYMLGKGAEIIPTDFNHVMRGAGYKISGGVVWYFSRLRLQWEESAWDVDEINHFIDKGWYERVTKDIVLKVGNLSYRIPKDKLADVILHLQKSEI